MEPQGDILNTSRVFQRTSFKLFEKKLKYKSYIFLDKQFIACNVIDF